MKIENKDLPEIKGNVIYNELLKKHTTFHIGGPCSAFIEACDEKDLKTILSFAHRNRIKYFIIGNGSNILASDEGFDGIVIKLSGKYFTQMQVKGALIHAGAGVLLPKLIQYSIRHSLKGMEGLVGIYGTVGGAIKMNAGFISDIQDVLYKVRVMDNKGNTQVINKKDISFSYRCSNLLKFIILEAWFKLKKGIKSKMQDECEKYLNMKRTSQPLDEPSAGCVFKNPKEGTFGAGKIIDLCGLRGKKIGGAQISEKHANFIVNYKNAKAKDVVELIKLIKQTVTKKFGINLETEIIII